MADKIYCCWSKCDKMIEEGEKYYSTSYGDYCFECYDKVVESVIGPIIKTSGIED